MQKLTILAPTDPFLAFLKPVATSLVYFQRYMVQKNEEKKFVRSGDFRLLSTMFLLQYAFGHFLQHKSQL